MKLLILEIKEVGSRSSLAKTFKDVGTNPEVWVPAPGSGLLAPVDLRGETGMMAGG